ncbi:MAG: HAD family hydrolase [Lachnospiraceae bacterium]|nr:HAD family hydrolase [Lachnospiraceae bacterium]
MSNIKLVVTDLDFTALRNDRTVSDYTAEVFSRCRSFGIQTSIATARFFFGAKPFMEKLQTDYAITNDGTMVYRGQEFWFGTSLGLERTTFLIQELKKADPSVRLSVSTRNGVFRNFSQVDYLTAPYSQFEVVDFNNSFQENAYKIVAEPTDPAPLQAIAQKADCKLLRYRGENRYTFLLENTGKLSALRSLAEHLGLSMSEVAVFGDDQNDLEMIRGCGLGIAVANAIPEVLSAAKDRARSNEEDGVARYIEEHFFSRSPD